MFATSRQQIEAQQPIVDQANKCLRGAVDRYSLHLWAYNGRIVSCPADEEPDLTRKELSPLLFECFIGQSVRLLWTTDMGDSRFEDFDTRWRHPFPMVWRWSLTDLCHVLTRSASAAAASQYIDIPATILVYHDKRAYFVMYERI